MENALEIRGLTKCYEGFRLDGITLELPRGYVMGLIGPNGAGKTTLIKLILNLVRREAGEIRIFGLDNRAREVEVKRRIGFVHEAPQLYDYLSLETLRGMAAPFYPSWDEAVFHRLADRFELPMGKRFGQLSRGTRLKFTLALALSHQAELLVLDEPTTGLDPVFRREFLDLLAGILQDERKSVIFSTHITSDLERIADYITLLQAGRLVFSAPRHEILERWGLVKGGLEQLDAGARALLRGWRRGAYGFEALTDDAAAVRRYFGPSVLVERPTLDDIVLHTFGSKDLSAPPADAGPGGAS